MATNPEYFSYAPLESQPGAFRLLRLKPGTSSRLEAELIHTTLEKEDNQYEAISYTWGDATIRDFIFIDGKPLGITYNLSLVLHDLRLQDSDRVLWNDATCINQNDLVEQGHQVHHMGNIYRGAGTVLFCIGRPTELTDLFIDTLNAFEEKIVCDGAQHSLWPQGTQDGNNSAEIPMRPKWGEFLDSLESKHHMLPHRLALAFQTMTKELWFHRVWIIQEVYNARRGIVYCGTKHISDVLFAWGGLLATEGRATEPASRPILEIMRTSRGPESKLLKRSRTLHQLITTFSSSKASNTYDKLYALLDMAADASDATSLVPDYTIDLPEVMGNTIKHLCRSVEAIPVPPQIMDMEEFIAAICDPSSSLLLEWAAGYGYLPFVQYVVELMSFPSGSFLPWRIRDDAMSGQPLAVAAKNGHESIVKLMLTVEGTDPTRRQRGRHALYYAAEIGHMSIVQVLLDTDRCSVSMKIDALNAAAENGHETVLNRILLACERERYWDCNLSTALLMASANGHAAIVKTLVQSGKLNININGSSCNNLYNNRPLHRAAFYGHTNVVGILLSCHDIDVNATNAEGWTPLNIAADKGHTAVVELLMSSTGLDVNLQNNRNGCTPLASAAKWRHEEIVKLLLEHPDINLNIHDKRDGSTALAWAASQGSAAIVKLLLDNGRVDVNATDSFKRTAYYMACHYKHKEVMQLFEDAGHDDVTGWDDIDDPESFYTFYPYMQSI